MPDHTTTTRRQWMACPYAGAVYRAMSGKVDQASELLRRRGHADSAIAETPHDLGGWDFTLPSAPQSPIVLRVTPSEVGGSFEDGVDLYVFRGPGRILHQKATLSYVTPETVGAVAAALAGDDR